VTVTNGYYHPSSPVERLYGDIQVAKAWAMIFGSSEDAKRASCPTTLEVAEDPDASRRLPWMRKRRDIMARQRINEIKERA